MKPKKPKKVIEQRNYASFPFDHVSKKVCLQTFLDWLEETVPAKSQDVTLELCEDWCYDDCFTRLEVSWLEKVKNPHYEKELAKYNKKLAK